jgi:hypothetical protein
MGNRRPRVMEMGNLIIQGIAITTLATGLRIVLKPHRGRTKIRIKTTMVMERPNKKSGVERSTPLFIYKIFYSTVTLFAKFLG